MGVATGRWQQMGGRELLLKAWWWPVPGIVLTGVLFAFLLSAGAGLAIAAIGWLGTVAFNVFLRSEGPLGPFHRRPWR